MDIFSRENNFLETEGGHNDESLAGFWIRMHN